MNVKAIQRATRMMMEDDGPNQKPSEALLDFMVENCVSDECRQQLLHDPPITLKKKSPKRPHTQ